MILYVCIFNLMVALMFLCIMFLYDAELGVSLSFGGHMYCIKIGNYKNALVIKDDDMDCMLCKAKKYVEVIFSKAIEKN